MIDAEAKAKILQANISNIVRKVKSGKPLSQPEIALLHGESERSQKQTSLDDTIGADALAKLTTLTDQRHRQLAKAGFFPDPVKGRYQTEKTIQGVIRYYREAAQVDINEEQLERRTRLQADLLQIEKDEKEGKLLPIEHVETAWEFIIVNLRQRIWHHQKLSDEIKRDLLSEIINIPERDYSAAKSEREHEQ